MERQTRETAMVETNHASVNRFDRLREIRSATSNAPVGVALTEDELTRERRQGSPQTGRSL